MFVMKINIKFLCLLFLIITTACKKEGTKEELVQVKANFTSDRVVINEGENITFENTSSGEINKYEWVFEGGNPATSTSEKPIVRYSKSGNYPVTLKVSNENISDSVTKENYITVSDILTADFKANKVKIEKGNSIAFTDLSIGNILSREWKFSGADIELSNKENPEIVYSKTGLYDVTLKVMSDDKESEEIKENYIEVVDEITMADIPSDFVVYYDFNNNIGDKSNLGNNGEAFNLSYSSDKNGNENAAGLFSSASNSYVKVPHSNSISLDKEMTISIWFYYTEQTSTSFFTIVEKSNPDDGGHSRYGMWIYNRGIIEICIEPDTCPGSLCQRCLDASSALPNLNEWYHLAGTYDGTTLKLYINGEESASREYAPSGISQTQFELFLGTDEYGSPNYLSGKLDNFRLYNRALSVAEIKQLSME